MQEACAEVATAYSLAQQFGEMVQGRRADLFDGWLEAASTRGVAELKTFSAGLRRDEKAVRAALTYEWSNGQTEGQVTKLKLFKRQGFGRSKVDLLRQRFAGAA